MPADYTVECSDEMPMDDATASDNCGEVTIEVSSETTAGDAAGNYVIVRTFTATDDAGNSGSASQTITVEDTTAPEFTFVPADYTVECSDEMPMDDATASDNCGEVTIEVSKRNHRGRCRRQLRDRSHLHRHRRCWQRLGLADHHRGRHRPEFTFGLPTTRSNAERCPWTTPRRQTTAEKSPSRCQAKPRAMPPATT